MLPRALLDELERVDRRLRLRAGEQLADGLLLAGVTLLDRRALRPFDQVECRVRSGSRTVHRVVDVVPRTAEDLPRVRPVGLEALERADGELTCKGERLVDELDRFKQPVGDAELRDVGCLEHPILPERI